VRKKGEVYQENAAEGEEEGVTLQAAGLEEAQEFADADAEVSRTADDEALKNPAIDPTEGTGEQLLPGNEAAVVEFVEVEFVGEDPDIERIGRDAPVEDARRADAEGDDQERDAEIE